MFKNMLKIARHHFDALEAAWMLACRALFFSRAQKPI
jgi:hypothetical protein